MSEYKPRYTEDQLVTPELEDRRRLAVAEVSLIVEQNGKATLYDVGQVILKHVTDTDEVLDMADKTHRVLAHRFGH